MDGLWQQGDSPILRLQFFVENNLSNCFMGVTLAYEISLWKTETAETDVLSNLRALQNLTLPADVINIYYINAASKLGSVKKYGYL